MSDHAPWHEMQVRIAGDCADCSAAAEPDEDDREALRAEVDAMPAQDLGWALHHLTESVRVLDESLLRWDGADIETLDLLGRVTEQRKLLAQIESLLETRAAKLMTGDVVEWPGGSAERRWGRDRKEWDHDGLTRAVARTLAETVAVNPATGEIDTDAARVAHEAITAYAATNRPSWRVTALKPLGIQPDEWCSSSPARPSVTVTLAAS